MKKNLRGIKTKRKAGKRKEFFANRQAHPFKVLYFLSQKRNFPLAYTTKDKEKTQRKCK